MISRGQSWLPCPWFTSYIKDWTCHPLLSFSIDPPYLYFALLPRCDNNHMDLGVFLTNENIEFSWTVCDYYCKIAHSQLLAVPVLQYQVWDIYLLYGCRIPLSRKQPSILTKTSTSLWDEVLCRILPTCACIVHRCTSLYILGIYRRCSHIFDLLKEWNLDSCGCLWFVLLNDVIW